MTSEIRANTIKNRVGLGTVTYTNTGIIVSGIVTANGIDCNGDIDVDGHTNLDNVSIAGVATHTGNAVFSGLTASGTIVGVNATFSGNINNSPAGNGSISGFGAITIQANTPALNFTESDADPDYRIIVADGVFRIQDVTNSFANRLIIGTTGNIEISKDLDVDGHTNLDNVSIAGVTTVSDHIKIIDNKKLLVGDRGVGTGDLEIYHTGSHSYIADEGAGELIISGSRIQFMNAGRSGKGLDFVEGSSGYLRLYQDNDIRLETTSTGVNIPCSSGATFIFGGTSGSMYRTGSPGGGLHLSGSAILPADGAGAVNNRGTDLGTSLYRWKGLYLGDELDIDTNDATDGHIMAKFNGVESGGNHAGLNIAHYLCGSDDNRTGLYWEHQNVSNERMWMGDDRRLYLKSSNPTESTAQGRYIMTVAAGYPDFPSGSSYDNAAYSALEIKKHYPNSQSGNYWIYDHNNVPRQIYCDMEIDGGGWMLWHDHNYGQTSMNEALGGSGLNPAGALSRSNWGNYAHYNVLIRATQIDGTGERLHSIVQLDGNGALKRVADYGGDFLLEHVGDLYQPNLNYYFNDASTGEYVGNTMMYQPQCGASGWQNFSNGGNSAVFIRELDSRLTPGMHRSCHLVERIYGFDDNGVPFWTVAESMHPMPFFGDVYLSGGGNGANEVADGTNSIMFENNRQIDADNGNNGGYAQGRMKGVLTGQFECEFKLGNSWGWSQATAVSTIQIAENLRDGGNPYNINAGPYAYYGIRNNNSNNQWNPFYLNPYNSTSSAHSGGANFSVGHVLWRVADGTIYARRKDGTHGTVNLGKWAGPLIVTSGSQSVMRTEWVNVWNSDKTDYYDSRPRWYK